ncbi:MAG: hypothetical protein MPJ08_08135 [Nitrosopumilus sp.]|nr:hypothetical protein [Nitrosopumilus sp.]
MPGPTPEDVERVRLLRLVSGSRSEFARLSLDQLTRLQRLLDRKDYSHDKKAAKSKKKLLRQINARIYELSESP